MRVLFLGDIVGRSGRTAVLTHLPELYEKLALDFVVANAENAAGGFGMTEAICNELFEAGVHVITSGNHVWDQKDTASYLSREPRVLRPGNFPAGTPGRGVAVHKDNRGRTAVVINVMGRIFMDPLDDPFALVEAELSRISLGRNAQFVLIDIHGEATSEKMAMGHFADGRASLVVGTHSHVPTADCQILSGGTAYQTDAGMCGDYDSVIGMDKQEPLQRFTRKIAHGRFTPALGEGTLCGVFVETDDATGLAKAVAPVRVGGRLQAALPVA